MVSSALTLLPLLAAAATVGPPEPVERLNAIDRFCDQLGPMTKQTQGRLFGLFGETRYREWTWHEYTDADAVERLVGDQVFDVANVWTRDDGAVALSWTIDTPSGDWVQL